VWKRYVLLIGALSFSLSGAFAQDAAPEPVPPNGMVILLTDYGMDSVYVGAIKGAIYATFPNARVDAITNSVPEFDVLAGAFCLAEAAPNFPAGTVFCCVVDPGVGTERRVVVLRTKSGHIFVAPDNGLLTLVADKLGIASSFEGNNRALWRDTIPSNTFHGRDIFGPLAANLASGVPIEKVGEPLAEIVRLDIPKSEVVEGKVSGVVIRVDSYGNIITNIPQEHLTTLGVNQNDLLKITLGKTEFTAPLVATYGAVEKGARLAVVQSAGYLEFAVNLGNLANETGEGLYAPVTVQKAS